MFIEMRDFEDHLKPGLKTYAEVRNYFANRDQFFPLTWHKRLGVGNHFPFKAKLDCTAFYQDRSYACSVCLLCFHLQGLGMVSSKFGKKLKLDTERSD